MRDVLEIAGVAMAGAFVSMALSWGVQRISEDSSSPRLTDPSIWIPGLFGGFVGASVEARRISIRRRRARMNREVAEKLKCQFVERVPRKEIGDLPEFSRSVQYSLSARDRMSGLYQGRDIDVFDVTFSLINSEEPTSQTIFRFPGAAEHSPQFRIAPRHWLTEILVLSGLTEPQVVPPDDVDTSVRSQFSSLRDSYHITVSDDPWPPSSLQRVFHPRLVGWLARNPGWSNELIYADVFAWKSNLLIAGPARLEALDELVRFLSFLLHRPVAQARPIMQATGEKPVRPLMDRSRVSLRKRYYILGTWRAATVMYLAGLFSFLAVCIVGLVAEAKTGGFLGMKLLILIASVAAAILGGRFGLRIARESGWSLDLPERNSAGTLRESSDTGQE